MADENERVLRFELSPTQVVIVRVGLSSTHPILNPPKPRRLGEIVLECGLGEDHVLGVTIAMDEEMGSHPDVTPPEPGFQQ